MESTLDEVRHDHLSCYGYDKIKTKNLDTIANNGILFKNAYASSCFTPVAHASILTGVNPNKHQKRDPYEAIQRKTIAEILKEQGYSTAGFVGVSLLSSKFGFGRGFDYFNEPQEMKEEMYTLSYHDPLMTEEVLLGHNWVDDMLQWMASIESFPFFIWGHYFQPHVGTEPGLLKTGKLQEGILTDFGYMDAKLKLMDEELFLPLISTLKDLGLYDDCVIVILSDHGTCTGEHIMEPVPFLDHTYPQHTHMYDEDLRIAFILKAPELKKGKTIPGIVRQIDLVPTLLDIIGINSKKEDFDGVSLLHFVNNNHAEGLTVYAEDLYDLRGPGAIQALRTEKFKFCRNLSTGFEEMYNLEHDPKEQNNIIDSNPKSLHLFSRKKQIWQISTNNII